MIKCLGNYNNQSSRCEFCVDKNICIQPSSSFSINYAPPQSRTVPVLKVNFKEQEYELTKPSDIKTISGVNIYCNIIGCQSCYFKEQCENYQKGRRYYKSSTQQEQASTEEKFNKNTIDNEIKIKGVNMVTLDKFMEKMELVEAKIEEFYRFIHEKDQEELKKQQETITTEEPKRGQGNKSAAIDDLCASNEVLWDRVLDKFYSDNLPSLENKLKNKFNSNTTTKEKKLKEDYEKLTKRAKKEKSELTYSFKYAQICVAIDWYELREGRKPDYILMGKDLYNKLIPFLPFSLDIEINGVTILTNEITNDFELLKIMEDYKC